MTRFFNFCLYEMHKLTIFFTFLCFKFGNSYISRLMSTSPTRWAHSSNIASRHQDGGTTTTSTTSTAPSNPGFVHTQSHCQHKGCWVPRPIHTTFAELNSLIKNLKTTAGRLHTLNPSELFGCQQKWVAVTSAATERVSDLQDKVAAELQGMMNERQNLIYSLEGSSAAESTAESADQAVSIRVHQQHLFRSLTSLVTLLGAHRGYILLTADAGNTFTLGASFVRPGVHPPRDENRFGTEMGGRRRSASSQHRSRSTSAGGNSAAGGTMNKNTTIHTPVPDEAEAASLLPPDLYECCERVAQNGLFLNVRMPQTQGSSLDTACVAPLRHPDHPLVLGVLCIVDKLPTTTSHIAGLTSTANSNNLKGASEEGGGSAAQAAREAMAELQAIQSDKKLAAFRSSGSTGTNTTQQAQTTSIFTPSDESRVCVTAEVISEYIFQSGLDTKFCGQHDMSVFQSARSLTQTWARGLQPDRCSAEGILPLATTSNALDLNHNALPRVQRDRQRVIPLRRPAHHFVCRIHTQPKIGSVWHDESNTIVRHPVRPVEVLGDIMCTLGEAKGDAKAMGARLDESIKREASAQETIRMLLTRLDQAKKETALQQVASQRLMGMMFLNERHKDNSNDETTAAPSFTTAAPTPTSHFDENSGVMRTNEEKAKRSHNDDDDEDENITDITQPIQKVQHPPTSSSMATAQVSHQREFHNRLTTPSSNTTALGGTGRFGGSAKFVPRAPTFSATPSASSSAPRPSSKHTPRGTTWNTKAIQHKFV